MLAWTAVLSWADSETQVDAWIACLRKADAFYVKARSTDRDDEEAVASDTAGLVGVAWNGHGLRGVRSVLRQRGQGEQMEDLEGAGWASGWQAVTNYDLFRHTTPMLTYVRRCVEEAMRGARGAEKTREQREVNSSGLATRSEMEQHGVGDYLALLGGEDRGLSEADGRATLDLIFRRASLSESQRRTAMLYLAVMGEFPMAQRAEHIREMAARERVSEETMRRCVDRLERKLKAMTPH
jgi:hypothetical protein